IVLACRPRPEDAARVGRNAFVAELKRELPPALRHLQQGNVAPVDFAQAAIGPGMAVTHGRLTVWEMTHQQLRVFYVEKAGEAATAALVRKLGSQAEIARD